MSVPGRRGVLVIDDAPLERAVFARYALREGWVIAAEAADARSALEVLRSTDADAAVIDGRLPPAGGLAVLPGVLADRPGMPVLVIATLEEPELAREALRLGAAGILLRPLLGSQVAEQLRRVARTLDAGRE